MSWRSKGDQAVPEEAPALTGDDDALAERLAELTHREVALRRITDVVEKQRTRLEERERALATSTSAAVADAEQRLADVTGRAEQAEQRARELEQRVQELEHHVSKLEARPEAQAPAPAVEAATPARAVDPEAADAPYTLQRLERFVRDAQLRGDPQAEEWAYYLPLLREHAEPDGRLPAQFASLVDSIFAD
jgi:DNA repair exonuclease SbcCD ATPase subunit